MGHIHTAKLDEELKAVTADGGTIVKPAQDIAGVGRFAVVLDPQKVKYLLFEPDKQDAPPRLDQMAVGNVGWHELLTDDPAKPLITTPGTTAGRKIMRMTWEPWAPTKPSGPISPSIPAE
jgi:hypothetical protein